MALDASSSFQSIDELLRLRFQIEELKQHNESLEDNIAKWDIVNKAMANLYVIPSFILLLSELQVYGTDWEAFGGRWIGGGKEEP